jgi:hypothetical protein
LKLAKRSLCIDNVAFAVSVCVIYSQNLPLI